MADRHRLKIELEKEELLLKNVKGKLLDQLQRLKVEELALEKYISLSNNTQSNQATSTGTYFSHQNPNTTETNQNDDQINSVPLTGLNEGLSSNALMLNNYAHCEEEEDD